VMHATEYLLFISIQS